MYQARFKSFPVETDDHFYTVVRYAERNALRGNPAATAEAWRWGSLWRRVHSVRTPLLTEWPLSEPRNWAQIVNQPQTEVELNAIRRCILSCAYGSDEWVQSTASSPSLESTLRGCEKIGTGTFATTDFPRFSRFPLGASPIFHSLSVRAAAPKSRRKRDSGKLPNLCS